MVHRDLYTTRSYMVHRDLYTTRSYMVHRDLYTTRSLTSIVHCCNSATVSNDRRTVSNDCMKNCQQ